MASGRGLKTHDVNSHVMRNRMVCTIRQQLAARRVKGENAYRVWVEETLKERGHCEDVDVDGEVIFK
jgi:hypothetical protein